MSRRRAPAPDLQAVLRHAGPALWGLCRRLDPDPEDAFQAIALRLAEQLTRFDPDGPASLRTWVVTVAHRALVDRHRRRLVRGEVVELDDVRVDVDPEAALDARRRAEALEVALLALPADQRRVVVLHHLEGVALDEIARVEGVALGTVKSRLHRGRARLVVALGGVG